MGIEYRLRFIAAFAASSLGVVACSSGSGGSPQSGFEQALGSTPATAASRAYFEYGSSAALRDLGVLNPAALQHSGELVDPRWTRVVAMGTGSLGTVSIDMTTKLNSLPGLGFELLYDGTIHYWDGACTAGSLRSRSR